MTVASVSESIMRGDVGGLVYAFAIVAITVGSAYYQCIGSNACGRMHGIFIMYMCRIAFNLSVVYPMAYVYLAFLSPEDAVEFSTHARLLTNNYDVFVPVLYLLLAFGCYLNIASFKNITPSTHGSLFIATVYWILYIVASLLYYAGATNWYITSLMYMSELTRLLMLLTVSFLSSLIDHRACTRIHQAHQKAAVLQTESP